MEDKKSGHDNDTTDRPGATADCSKGPTATDSIDVVQIVAETVGSEETELPPIAEAVDPDALDSLLDQEDKQGDARLSFMYAGVAVTVCQDGSVEVSG